MNVIDDLRNLRDELRTERDELKLQAHLLKAEVKDEWEEVEKQWLEFESRVNEKTKTAARAAHDFADASRDLGTDIKAAYQRFRRSL